MIIICARCLKEAASVWHHLTICVPCNDALTAANQCYCNRCQTAKKPLEMAERWFCKACVNDRQRNRYATNPVVRATHQAASLDWRRRHPRTNAAYLKQWRALNPTYATQRMVRDQENARRRERYATDPVYRQRILARVVQRRKERV
jgi:hypothetical protein